MSTSKNRFKSITSETTSEVFAESILFSGVKNCRHATRTRYLHSNKDIEPIYNSWINLDAKNHRSLYQKAKRVINDSIEMAELVELKNVWKILNARDIYDASSDQV